MKKNYYDMEEVRHRIDMRLAENNGKRIMLENEEKELRDFRENVLLAIDATDTAPNIKQ